MTTREFGRIVKQRRYYYYGKRKGFLALARQAGIAKGLLSKVENGKTNPSLSTMNKLAKALYFEIRTNT